MSVSSKASNAGDMTEEEEDGVLGELSSPLDLDDPVDAKGHAINTQLVYNQMIHKELLLPQGGVMRPAKVIGQSVGPSGSTMGAYHKDPTHNTLIYDVEFDNGLVQ